VERDLAVAAVLVPSDKVGNLAAAVKVEMVQHHLFQEVLLPTLEVVAVALMILEKLVLLEG